MDDLDEILKYSQTLTLLYVEDNEESRDATKLVFDEFFSNIIIGLDGQDGYEKFKENKIDIIITDINMPRLDGLGMIDKIRKIDKDVPILVLSAYNESNYFMESIKIGVEGYLLKPIDINQFLTSLKSITENIKLKDESEQNLSLLTQYQEITDKSAIVSKTDLDGNITYVNDIFISSSEYTKEELIGKNYLIIRHPNNEKEFYDEIWETVKNKKEIWKGTIRNISKNGKVFYSRTTIKPILNKFNEVIEYIALEKDVTNIMKPQKLLEDLIDSQNIPMLMLAKIIDYETLKKFYGHKKISEIEDQFSVFLFTIMQTKFSFEDVFVLGDGSFAFSQDKSKSIQDLSNIEKSIQEIIYEVNKKDFIIDDIVYDISIMISFSYGDNVFDNTLLGLKELESLKQDYICSNNLASMEHNKAQKNMQTLQLVNTAINNNKIVSYFQPIIDNKTQKIVKYESLVRLVNKEEQVLAPFFFLDVAKKGKFYSQITKIVLQNSFEALQKTDKSISMNLSALDIEKESISNFIFDILEKNKINANRVVFELLEDENIKDMNVVKRFITRVKNYGVKIAIDDFGAGYSNFERLLNYQPDILKIDASLVKNILKDDYSLAIVKTLVTFAKSQNIEIIAEYVENKEIFELLKSLHIEYSQGYYFGKPEPLE